ncbi:unnamed protein product [Sphagnum jensenii]
MHGSWVMDGVSSLGRWRQRKNAIAVGDARQLRLPPRESSFGATKTILLLCFALSAFTSIDCASLSIVLLLFSARILLLCSVFCAQSCWVPACRCYILCSLSREEGQEDKDLVGYSSWNKKPMGAGLAGDRAVDAGMD